MQCQCFKKETWWGRWWWCVWWQAAGGAEQTFPSSSHAVTTPLPHATIYRSFIAHSSSANAVVMRAAGVAAFPFLFFSNKAARVGRHRCGLPAEGHRRHGRHKGIWVQVDQRRPGRDSSLLVVRLGLNDTAMECNVIRNSIIWQNKPHLLGKATRPSTPDGGRLHSARVMERRISILDMIIVPPCGRSRVLPVIRGARLMRAGNEAASSSGRRLSSPSVTGVVR